MLFELFCIDEADNNVETQDVSDQATDGSARSTNGQYKCRAIGCGKMYATLQKLVRHRKFKCVHCKKFKCTRCHESFGLQFMLNKHTCSGGLPNGPIATPSKPAPS